MFTITDSALEQLSEALGRIEDPKPENACFRIMPSPDGKLTLAIDAPAPNDTEYERDGSTVLVLSEKIKDLCKDRKLDSNASGQLILT